ncbi:MAG: hypothetical protein HYX71_01680 [Opitutae bacterium]|nr:hypothetical protein [Opitutae bacterium]
MNTRTSRLKSQRGSLLIVSMIMCAIIGISIVSYLNLGKSSQSIANRALYNNGAMNIAEYGMEEAMYSINQMVSNPSYTWSGWTSTNGGADAYRKWTSFTLDQNSTGVVRVYVKNADGALAPTILARSTVTLGGATSAPIEKWIKITLAMTSKFANGLVAKNTITFSGNNATVDSWNSDPDNNSATTAIKYSTTTKDDNGSVGSVSVAVNVVGVNNADIWGYVATGGSPASVGSNGLVGPWGTTSGTIAAGHSSTDFSASFDNVTAPSTYTYNVIGTINNDTTLPGTITAAADGKYYIEAPAINFNNKTLTISAGKEVVLKLTNTGSGPSAAISVGGGSGGINITATGKLVVYTAGDIDIAGNGVMNGGTTDAAAGQPINFQLWGTKTSGTQDIKIAGNGVLSGIVYAPFGSVKINGNGSVSGSIVANDITVVGNAAFHYDESLGSFGGNPYRVAAWTELTTADARTQACTDMGSAMTF